MIYFKHVKLRYGSLFLSVHLSKLNNMLNLMGPGKNSDVKYESFHLFIVGAAVARVLDSHGAVQTNHSALNAYDAFLF